MQINDLSGINQPNGYSFIQNQSNGNNQNHFYMKALESIQKRISEVKCSDMDQSLKDVTLKALEEELTNLQSQMAAAASSRLNQTAEAIKSSKEKTEKADVLTEILEEKGFNVAISDDLAYGVISASSSMEVAQTLKGQYTAVKSRLSAAEMSGDTEAAIAAEISMNRVMTYQANYYGEALQTMHAISDSTPANELQSAGNDNSTDKILNKEIKDNGNDSQAVIPENNTTSEKKDTVQNGSAINIEV